MPGNLPVPQGVQMILTWSGPDATPEALTVMHLRNGGNTPIDASLALAVETAVKNAFNSSGIATHIIPGVLMSTVSIRDLSDLTRPAFSSNTVLASGGAVNATPLPANVSLCVSGVTGLRGASFRSRTYLWGFSVASVATTGGVDQATADSAAAFMNGLRTAMAGLPNPLPVVVLSRFWTPPQGAPGTERTTPLMTNIANYVVKDLRWDTQRRRAIPGV